MKILMCILFFIPFTFAAKDDFSGKYKIDSAHTHIGFKVKHLGVTWVRGKFDKFEGTGNFDEKTNKISDAIISIDTTSINTNEPDRDKHLKSPDFFEVEKFPKMDFKISNIEYSKKSPKKIIGDLTLKGVTKKMEFNVVSWGGTIEDPWGNKKIGFELEGKLDRRDFGLTWNKGLKKVGGLTVGNEVFLNLEFEAVKID